jgi:IS1 family transposase
LCLFFPWDATTKGPHAAHVFGTVRQNCLLKLLRTTKKEEEKTGHREAKKETDRYGHCRKAERGGKLHTYLLERHNADERSMALFRVFF